MFLTAVGWEVGKGKQEKVQMVCQRQRVFGRKMEACEERLWQQGQCYINDQVQPYLFNAFLEVQLRPVHNMNRETTMIQSEGQMDSASRHLL